MSADGEFNGNAVRHCSLDVSRRGESDAICFIISERSRTTISGVSFNREVMLQICGVMDLFRKKSRGLIEVTACKWSCVVGEFTGSKEGEALPVGCWTHAALSCIDLRLRLRDGIEVFQH